MQTIPLDDADGHLAEIVDKLTPGDEVVFTRNDVPVATLRAMPPIQDPPRFGTLKGTIVKIAADFDDIPEGFEDYLP